MHWFLVSTFTKHQRILCTIVSISHEFTSQGEYDLESMLSYWAGVRSGDCGLRELQAADSAQFFEEKRTFSKVEHIKLRGNWKLPLISL